MATTPIYAGGSRRGAAPRVAQREADRTAALGYDEDLMRQLLGSFAQQQSGQASSVASASGTAVPSLAEAIGSGTNVIDFGDGTSATDFGGGGDSAGAGAGAGAPGGISAGTVGAIGAGLSALGALGQAPALGQVGGMMGLAGAIGSSNSNSQALGTFGQAALSAMGVPGVGLASNAITGNVPGMVNAAISMANPAIGAANVISGLLGIGTIGSLFGGGGGDAGTPGQSDVSNATGIEGLGFSDAAYGPPDSPSDGLGFGFGTDGTDTGSSDGGGRDSGGSGGDAGGKIICTKLHELGMMPTAIYEADQAFGKQLVATAPATYAGYVRWARHIVALMERTDWVGKLAVFGAYHIATPWSIAMAAEMGMPVKPTWFGRFLLRRGLQFCSLVSKLPSK
jgi:hypothetical protein